MWKWTDPKNIKVVILDTDSLDKDYLPFPYSQYLPNVQLFFINKNKKRNKILGDFNYASNRMSFIFLKRFFHGKSFLNVIIHDFIILHSDNSVSNTL